MDFQYCLFAGVTGEVDTVGGGNKYNSAFSQNSAFYSAFSQTQTPFIFYFNLITISKVERKEMTEINTYADA